MRKAYVSVTVLRCPEAWTLFCETFPSAIVAEIPGQPDILTVYVDGEEDT